MERYDIQGMSNVTLNHEYTVYGTTIAYLYNCKPVFKIQVSICCWKIKIEGVCKKNLTVSCIINQVYMLDMLRASSDLLEKIYSYVSGEEKGLKLILAQLFKINTILSL